jgi:hypothetical protein
MCLRRFDSCGTQHPDNLKYVSAVSSQKEWCWYSDTMKEKENTWENVLDKKQTFKT